MIKGGSGLGIVPDLCDITLNLRLLPQHAKKEVVNEWLSKIIQKISSTDPSFRAEITNSNSEALDVPEDSEVVQLLMDILKTKPTGVPYYTEAVSYTKAGIPTVICGPGDIEQAHAANEFITLEQLDKGTKLFKDVIRQVCL